MFQSVYVVKVTLYIDMSRTGDIGARSSCSPRRRCIPNSATEAKTTATPTRPASDGPGSSKTSVRGPIVFVCVRAEPTRIIEAEWRVAGLSSRQTHWFPRCLGIGLELPRGRPARVHRCAVPLWSSESPVCSTRALYSARLLKPIIE